VDGKYEEDPKGNSFWLARNPSMKIQVPSPVTLQIKEKIGGASIVFNWDCIVYSGGLAMRIDPLGQSGILFFSDRSASRGQQQRANSSDLVDTRQSPDEAEKFDAGRWPPIEQYPRCCNG